jgi:hypothetical protein
MFHPTYFGPVERTGMPRHLRFARKTIQKSGRTIWVSRGTWSGLDGVFLR